MRRQRLPAAEEKKIREQRRAAILTLMQMDTLYHRAGEYVSANAFARQLDITLLAAAHCLSSMRNEGILESIQRRNAARSGIENWYRKKPESMLTKPWRKSYKWHPKPFYDFGAPMR
jgi:hypothetical protein